MGYSQELYKQAKRYIPGGTQLLSKRPEMFLPDQWPAYYKKAKGCQIVDLDGKKYIDMSYMGIGSCILGYADDDVNRAVIKTIADGSMATLNAPEEPALAKALIRLHPWADMVRYARSGGEAMAVAVRIARAASKRDIVLFCGYHGWHDWYLSANLASDTALDGHLLPGLSPRGVPRFLRGTAFPFTYNDRDGFLKLIARHKNNIGAVVMEPIRSVEPTAAFLTAVRAATKKLKIPLVVDEITAGFRLTVGGAHLKFCLEPDLAVFAKGISNGFPMAAIIGKEKYMCVAQDTFISSTYWTERIGPVAALTSIQKIKDLNIPKYLAAVGGDVQDAWRRLAVKHALRIEVSGILPLGHFSFQYANSLELKTLFTQLMLERGFLAINAFYASYAHQPLYVKRYLDAVDDSFRCIARALRCGTVNKQLKGPVCHSGFKRIA